MVVMVDEVGICVDGNVGHRPMIGVLAFIFSLYIFGVVIRLTC